VDIRSNKRLPDANGLPGGGIEGEYNPDTALVNTMRSVMSKPFEWFTQFGELREGRGGKWRETARHIYINRGSNILGVAHLDSVQKFRGFWINKDYISCATIDNRMGAWLMLYGLPAMGIEMDVLLTENEESGCSTASDFIPSKEYNWGFSFDRGGDDIACYQYYNQDVVAMMKSHGMKATWGSYSDVADLDLNAKCFNFGCGMHSYHSETAYIRKWELNKMLVGFESFYQEYKGTHLPHKERVKWIDQWEDDYGPMTKYVQPYTPPREWEDPNYFRQMAKDDYETDTKVTYYPAKTSNLYGGYGGSLVDNYHARQATDEPGRFFGDTDDAQDWWYNHSVGDVNDPNLEADTIAIWEENILVVCECCENLFAHGDIERYASISEWLCKACFHSFAITYYGS
jgi:hypothetical protein